MEGRQNKDRGLTDVATLIWIYEGYWLPPYCDKREQLSNFRQQDHLTKFSSLISTQKSQCYENKLFKEKYAILMLLGLTVPRKPEWGKNYLHSTFLHLFCFI